MDNNWTVLVKLSTHNPYDTVILLLSVCPREALMCAHQEMGTEKFTAVLGIISKREII